MCRKINSDKGRKEVHLQGKAPDSLKNWKFNKYLKSIRVGGLTNEKDNYESVISSACCVDSRHASCAGTEGPGQGENGILLSVLSEMIFGNIFGSLL